MQILKTTKSTGMSIDNRSEKIINEGSKNK